MSLLVLDPGLSSRLVDFGRPNSRGLGVPVGGAGDRAGLILGNGLVGNPPDALALEIALRGPTLRADAEVGCVLFGAPFDMSTARQKPRSGRTFTLAAGEELHITGTPTGMRAYFCVRGGFEAPLILGGHSGLDDVRRGDRLRCAASRIDVTTRHRVSIGSPSSMMNPQLRYSGRAPLIARSLKRPPKYGSATTAFLARSMRLMEPTPRLATKRCLPLGEAASAMGTLAGLASLGPSEKTIEFNPRRRESMTAGPREGR